MTQTVVLVVGISGSGKSTKINKGLQYHRDHKQTYGICSADHFWIQPDGSYKFDFTKLGDAHKQCQKNFRYLLSEGIDYIYVDNTNLTKKERSFYLNAAKEAGARIIVTVFPVDVDLSEARNVHGVPRATLEAMAKKIDLTPGMYSVLYENDAFEYCHIGDLMNE